mmetsp:Transcript_80114/g.158716  ORF Transcript_80114/g.158716 Transcript_80114/m.158716 type:complete len:85 (-) Transcript_80114:31-285(-)
MIRLTTNTLCGSFSRARVVSSAKKQRLYVSRPRAPRWALLVLHEFPWAPDAGSKMIKVLHVFPWALDTGNKTIKTIPCVCNVDW